MSLRRENIFAPITIREGDEDTERGWAWEGYMKILEERGGGGVVQLYFLKKEEQCFSVNFKPGDPFLITVT